MIKWGINFFKTNKNNFSTGMIARQKVRHFGYHNKKLSNPFFQKRRRLTIRKYKWSWRSRLVFIEIIIIIVAIIWFAFFSTVFNINKINIEGLTRISEKEINDIAWQQTKSHRWILGSQQNIFLFNKKKLIETLNQKYCFVFLDIGKKLPDTLVLNIEEKSYAFIWFESDKYYYVDIDGYIIDEVNPLEIKQKKYPLIYNEKEEKNGVKSLDKIEIINIEKNYLSSILDLFNEFNGNAYNFAIERFIITDEANTIKMAIYQGPIIYFNSNEDLKKQINKLVVIKNEKLKEDFINKEYIDLRYGDRVYYR